MTARSAGNRERCPNGEFCMRNLCHALHCVRAGLWKDGYTTKDGALVDRTDAEWVNRIAEREP